MLDTVLIVALVLGLVAVGLVVLSVLGVFLAGATGTAASRRAEREAARGWTRAASDPALADRFRGAPFGVGRDRTVEQVWRGEHAGRAFVAFDLAFTDGDRSDGLDAGPVRRTYAVVALEVGHPTAPVSVLRTESPVPRFDEAPGAEVTVERAAFPHLYRVRTPEPELAEALLHPAAVDRVLGLPAIAWRLSDGWLLAISTVPMTPLQVQYVLEVLETMLRGLGRPA